MKSDALSRAFNDKPPYYEHEVLANLEEFNKNNANITDVLSGLNNYADNLISTVSDEAELSRMQDAINAERISEGISETNYRLLDLYTGLDSMSSNLSSGLDRLAETTRDSAYDIIQQLRHSERETTFQFEAVRRKLGKINENVSWVNFNLEIINNSLLHIGELLSVITKKISNPNEVNAIELADQARISLAIGRNEEALRATRKAMELCGTSIIVTAYHIMTLSTFNSDDFRDEIYECYVSFVKLVQFKLKDKGSDQKQVRNEILQVFFPVMYAVSAAISSRALQHTENLYNSLSEDNSTIHNILIQPFKNNEIIPMITHPSPLRELHCSIILKNEIILNN